MATLQVQPGQNEIANSLVAIWDQDVAHFGADPVWVSFGGAFIAGDPTNPSKSYLVTDTYAVTQAINKGRLVIVPPVTE